MFAGADGRFKLYDDAGDGPAEGVRIPMRYEDAAAALTLGVCEGRLPEPAEIRFRLIRPEGAPIEKTARYDGTGLRICFER